MLNNFKNNHHRNQSEKTQPHQKNEVSNFLIKLRLPFSPHGAIRKNAGDQEQDYQRTYALINYRLICNLREFYESQYHKADAQQV